MRFDAIFWIVLYWLLGPPGAVAFVSRCPQHAGSWRLPSHGDHPAAPFGRVLMALSLILDSLEGLGKMSAAMIRVRSRNYPPWLACALSALWAPYPQRTGTLTVCRYLSVVETWWQIRRARQRLHLGASLWRRLISATFHTCMHCKQK
jgi:hypothetical protein